MWQREISLKGDGGHAESIHVVVKEQLISFFACDGKERGTRELFFLSFSLKRISEPLPLELEHPCCSSWPPGLCSPRDPKASSPASLLWCLRSCAPLDWDFTLCLSQACTLARRNAEVFLKYIHRNNVSMPSAASHTRGPEQQVKGQCEPCRPEATPATWTRAWYLVFM